MVLVPLTVLLSCLVQYWGGGVFCGENYEHLPATVPCLLPQKDGSTINAMCYNADIRPVCTDNGYVKLPYGSGPYIGMGLLVSRASTSVVLWQTYVVCFATTSKLTVMVPNSACLCWASRASLAMQQ